MPDVTKIRRFLRDPDGNIWDDAFLLGLWNDEQREYSRKHWVSEEATVLLFPAQFQMSYMFDHEWTFSGYADGNVRQCLLETYEYRCCQPWEIKGLGGVDGEETSIGDRTTHPWESYMISTPADMVPMTFPTDHHKTLFMAYDMEPLSFKPFKDLSMGDRAFRTYAGSPEYYTVKDEISEAFYIYPRPSTVEFDTTDVESEYNVGGGTGAIYTDISDNILIVYKPTAVDLDSISDDPVQPVWVRKYLEYGVLEKAYKANTDGRISSLADYWGWRKSLGDKILTDYKFKRIQDRNFQLGSSMVPRRQRGPRLPSTYPPV